MDAKGLMRAVEKLPPGALHVDAHIRSRGVTIRTNDDKPLAEIWYGGYGPIEIGLAFVCAVNHIRSAEYAEIVRDAGRWRSMLAMIGDEDLRVECKVFECRPGSPLSDRASYAPIDADELKDAIDHREPK